MSEPAEPLPLFNDPSFGEPLFAEPQFAELRLDEPELGDPLFGGPLFAEPALPPLSAPEAELAAVPIRPARPRPGPALPVHMLAANAAGIAANAPRLSAEASRFATPAPDRDTPGRDTPDRDTPDRDTPDGHAPGLPAPWSGLAAPWSVPPELVGPASGAAHAAAPNAIVAAAVMLDPAAATSTSTQARPPAARVVSGRGVTGRGVVVLILILTGFIGLLEVALSGHRGAAFAITFVLTSAIGALVVRRRDLAVAIIAPPLLYCVLIAVLSVFDTHDQTGGFITREGIYIGNAFVTSAPTLWVGTAAAGAIAWYRHRAARPRG